MYINLGGYSTDTKLLNTEEHVFAILTEYWQVFPNEKEKHTVKAGSNEKPRAAAEETTSTPHANETGTVNK
jgi:uncharacterized protein YdaU (DUF1376 family)